METRFDTQDIVGKQFGKLTVLEYCGRNEKGRHIYKCQCECGTVCVVQRDCLRGESTKSCGCLAKCTISPDDIIGHRYGRITVIKYLGKKERHQGKAPEHFYLCHCDCGNDVEIFRKTLLSGRINNCGHCARIVRENEYYRYICSNGESWIFDEVDLEFVEDHRWYISHDGYPHTKVKNKDIVFHRLLFNLSGREVVDHVNGDSRDNRRANLRITSQSMNMQNQTIKKTNTSGFKGVSFNKGVKKYEAYINYAPYKKKKLGLFDNPEEAARAYDEAARKYFGEFACVNFPRPGERGCHREIQAASINLEIEAGEMKAAI